MTTGPEDARVERSRQGLQRLVAVLAVAVIPWLVAPGLVQPDTKSDLVVSPGRYLGRALWAWNDHTGIGELQNQAYGYLWPMGPVFLAGDAAGAPEWVVQRLWWTLILVVAFVGAERLARRVGGLTTVPALLTGLVFALSPRVLTVLSEISVEVWPQALAPWLVLVAARGVAPGAVGADRRRLAVGTGLLAACLGGVNATVSLVALIPAALWILLAPAHRHRWRSLSWWLLGAVLGSAWWLGPLVVLGRYSYPFLDHIELASTTTAVASLVNVLRGANHWIAYILTDGDHPTWQGGWLLAQTVTGILATTAVAALGLAGLVRARGERGDEDAPVRHLTRWALVMVLLGVLAMAVGRSGSASGPLAPLVQDWLDGPLAPLRNVHKADVLVRVPMALGVGLLAHWATRIEHGATAWVRQLVVTTMVLALVGSMAPLWVSRVGDAWAPTGVPSSWTRAAERVDRMAASDGGTTLVLPGARHADFTWGRMTDEPLTSLAASPVLVRAAAPLGHPGATRILDHLDELTATGRSQPQLAAGLRRLGVSRVVVRGGLIDDVGTVDPQRVAATLQASPGFSLHWSQGDGTDRVSVWRLDEPALPMVLVPAHGVVPVAGSPEAWFALVAADLLDPRAVTTTPQGSQAQIRTDTLRWQALNSGRPPARGHSPTLPQDNLWPAVVGTRDLQPGGLPEGRTTRFYDGLSGVTVSSSAADPFARHWRGAGDGPAAMLDGDARTSWVSGDGAATQRVTLDLQSPARPSAVLVHEAWGADVAGLAAVTVGGSDGQRPEGSMTWRVPLDGSTRKSIDLELTRARGAMQDAPVGIREVELEDGPDLATGLELPAGRGPVLITRDPRGAAEPARGEDPSDLVRAVGALPRTRVGATVRVRPGDEAQDLVTRPWSLRGSTAPDPVDAGQGLTSWPVAALDDDPGTRWRPATGTPRPVLALDLGERRLVETITLDRAVGPVTVATDTQRYVLPSGTSLTIPAQRTRNLSLTFTRAPGRALWAGPEVSLSGVGGPTERVALACGDAGAVGRQDGRIGLALDADRGSMIAGDALPVTACGELPDGSADISALAAPGLIPDSVTLVPRDWSRTEVTTRRSVTSQRQHAGRWTFDVGAGESSLLVLSQGANPGWRATDGDGDDLESLTVDGWRQAFVVPEGGARRVLVDFAPNAQHRLALTVGAAMVLLLLLWGLVETRARRRPGDRTGAVLPAGSLALPPPGAGSPGPPLVVAALLAAVVGILVAGWVGALAAALGALVPQRLRAVGVAVVLLGASVALAVLGVAERQSTGALVSQALGALSLGLLVAALVRPSPGGSDRAPGSPPGSTTGDPDPR